MDDDGGFGRRLSQGPLLLQVDRRMLRKAVRTALVLAVVMSALMLLQVRGVLRGASTFGSWVVIILTAAGVALNTRLALHHLKLIHSPDLEISHAGIRPATPEGVLHPWERIRRARVAFSGLFLDTPESPPLLVSRAVPEYPLIESWILRRLRQD